MYASYMAAVMPRHLDLAAKHQVNLIGAVTWAFEFEDQPYFDGFRDLATNGIDKPVLNVFRMLGKMTGDRVAVENPAVIPLDQIVVSGVRNQPDVYAFASSDARSVAVLVSNYHDSEKPGPAAQIELTIAGLPSSRLTLNHYRMDGQFSNSYEHWKKIGSPQKPTPAQYSELERAGQLQTVSAPAPITAQGGKAKLNFSLPLHGVSLIQLTW
jgi:xylan 1,4-beta-xylosidase